MRKLHSKLRKSAAFILLLALLLTTMASPAMATTQVTSSASAKEGPYESYTYWGLGGSSKSISYMKPVYEIKTTISASSMGIPLMSKISDVCSDKNGNVYILDSDAAQIHILNNEYEYQYTLSSFTYEGEEQSILGAAGIYERDGLLYIGNTKQSCVLVMDTQGNVLAKLGKPESRLIPEGFNYAPQKVAVDSKGYMYVSCDGSYYGAIVFSPELEFLGFYGANTVPVTVLDFLTGLVEDLFANDVKKGASALALPYQIVDLAVGSEDFIYTATGRQTKLYTMTGQVSVMNPGGKNILANSTSYNFADTAVGVYNSRTLIQNISGIDVDEDGFFYIVDSSYGRVYWYDEECNLMGVFGGSMGTGTQKGTTQYAKGVALNGLDVMVFDDTKNTVNIFGLTDYGKLLRTAQIETLMDNYAEALMLWEDVLAQDQNSQLAYRGLAKGYYTLGENDKAAEYAKLGSDRDTYANAFEKQRTAFLEKWFAPLFVAVVLLVVGLIVFSVFKKKKQFKFIRNEKVKVMTGSIAHTVESFRLVKEKQMGSLPLAFGLLIAYYLISAVSDVAKGFAFNYFNAADYSSFYVMLRTVGLVVLWTVANWLVCVLLGGIGKLKEIFIVTCYSLIPLIFSEVLSLVLSYVMIPDEFAFVEIFQTACLLYTAFMLIVGIMRVHDFEFGRFLGTTVLTLLSMVIIVFLIFLVILLAQQVFSWVMTLYIEIRYR